MDEQKTQTSGKSDYKLGELLVKLSIITEDMLKQALGEQKITGQPLPEIIVEKGWVSAVELKRALSAELDVETVNVYEHIITHDLIALVPKEDARRFVAIPLYKSGDTLYVAMKNPNDVFALDYLHRKTKLKVKPYLASEAEIIWAIEQYYKAAGAIDEILSNINAEKLAKGDKEQEINIVKLVDLLIMQAVHDNASDIHIEPEEKTLQVRYRIDGILHTQYVLPKYLHPSVTSRVKIIASLDIAEKRLPQDGKIQLTVESKKIDFRVSSCPTVQGENVVLRVLDKSGLVVAGLEALGMFPAELEMFRKMITSPYGIILVTGPTGSGKTTTLYSALQVLNTEEVNIMTIEDPVEYQFFGLKQMQVNSKIGLTFSNSLRSFLRQDPDIILVGEIRDLETAEIAVQAALTGHLVFSTLHTNDAPTSFTRLVDMGVEPFLVANSLVGVIAQRLLRKVCSHCVMTRAPAPAVLKMLGMEEHQAGDVKFVEARGCKYCNESGYKGRVGIFEVLRATPEIQQLVLNRASADEIRKVACSQGMRTLREAAIEKVISGITTPEEVLRVTLSQGL